MRCILCLQLTVGTHRVWASEAVALLVEAGNAVVDGCVAAAKLIPRVLHLAVYRPLCSALHYRCVNIKVVNYWRLQPAHSFGSLAPGKLPTRSLYLSVQATGVLSPQQKGLNGADVKTCVA